MNEISVLIPVLNEEPYLDDLLSNLINEENLDLCEFFLIDGGSTDGTIEKIKEWQKKFSFVHEVNNTQKYANLGFNKALPLTKGRYIAFLGAHAGYPQQFLNTSKKYLDSNVCDAVGGPLLQKAKSIKGLAIAYAMSSRFGVGDTEFRTSSNKRYVDSVAFAVYKREVFDKIGLLDEQLIRNQDDEFHYRMNAAGYKILMVPEMQCTYYVRETLSGLFKQYFQYGLFKPLVLKKVKSGIRLRHLIPALFVLYLLLLWPAYILMGWIACMPLFLYLLLDLFFALHAPVFPQKVISILVFPILHLSYGIGFLIGIRKLF
jgi:GT2 family glycosyltransferase